METHWLQPEHKQFWVATLNLKGAGSREAIVGGVGIDLNGGGNVRKFVDAGAEQGSQGSGEKHHASIHHLAVRAFCALWAHWSFLCRVRQWLDLAWKMPFKTPCMHSA